MKEKLQSHCLKWILGYLNGREHFVIEEWTTVKNELLSNLINDEGNTCDQNRITEIYFCHIYECIII